jgi:hypothetical protein
MNIQSNWLRGNGFIIEDIPCAGIAKREGLMRFSTLSLIRD